jgi:hypothetical protein
MNLTLPAGGTSFALIHAAGQGPRNPRPLRELRNIGEKSHRITPAKRAAQTAVVLTLRTSCWYVRPRGGAETMLARTHAAPRQRPNH